MLLDASRFSFTEPLERNFDVLRRELGQLRRDDFQPWPVPGACTGAWFIYPFFLHSQPPQLEVDFESNQRRCPRTMDVLAEVPRVVSASYSWMEPGCHVFPHRDKDEPHLVRAHLGMRTPPEAGIRVHGDIHHWQTGKVLVFDGQLFHEVANLACHEPRVIMLVDSVMTAEERRYMEEASPARNGEGEE